MKKHVGIRSVLSSLAAKRTREFKRRRYNVIAESLESRMLLTATLGDYVWVDTDGNGQQDVIEPGLNGVGVELTGAGLDGMFGSGDDTFDSQFTVNNGTNDGAYSFANLNPGFYKVRFAELVGYTRTAPNVGADGTDSDASVGSGFTQIITLAVDEINDTVDAGYSEKAAIGDFVWNDLDADGVQDTLEPGIPNATVHLKDALGVIIDTTTTDADGMYWFTNLEPGAYAVQFELPAGFMFSSPQDNGVGDDRDDSDADQLTGMTDFYDLFAGEYDDTIDAGFYNILDDPSVGDFVWNDLNCNGQQDADEPGINGVTVILTGAGPDEQFGTGDDTTDIRITANNGTNDGAYLFTDLAPGQYLVTFLDLPVGFLLTTPDNGDDTTDSDPDPLTGTTGVYVLSMGDTNLSVDAGLCQESASMIGDYAWVDTDGDGQQDVTEPGLNGVLVTLTGAGLDGNFGTSDDTTDVKITANNGTNDGAYKFDGLAPGSYKVTFGALAGYTRTVADTVPDATDSDADVGTGMTGPYTLVSGQYNDTVDAGYVLAASKSGCVYLDTNGNGIHDEAVVDLGLASQFGVFGINGGNLILNSAHITGNVGLGPGETATTLQKADVSGSLTVDPGATWDSSNFGGDFLVAGGVLIQSLAQAAADANAASVAAAALPADFVFGSVTANTMVTATAASRVDGVTVVSMTSLNYNTDVLTLSGTATDVFVVNVQGDWTYFDSQILLTGGLTADHVIFNFTSAGATIEFSKATNVVNGTFLAPYGSVLYHNPASFNGAIIARNITIHSDANLNSIPVSPAEGCLAGVTVSLIGTDGTGQSVSRVTATSTAGYNFSDLPPGTYTVTVTPPPGYEVGAINVGTNNGAPDGIAAPPNQITQIVLHSGDNAIDNDFGLVRVYDLGDAPTSAQSGFAGSYPTLLSANGASHVITSALKLGTQIDGEANGQPNATATGDDTNGPIDDEDGVAFTSLVEAAATASVSVTVSGSGGYLNAWLDFNRDGDWNDSGEQIFTNQSVVNGLNSLMFAVPAGAIAGDSFARFRLSTQQNLTPVGVAPNGEVEDYKVIIGCATSPIGGVNLGSLPNYLFLFTDGSQDANWQGATKGFIGNVAVNGITASERTSGTVPFAGRIYSNASTLGPWQNIVTKNPGQAFASTGQTTLISELTTQLNSAFTQINSLTATNLSPSLDFRSRSSTSLNGLNTQNSIAETFVINVTSGFQVSSKINITGDADDVFILRWDTDAHFADGYEGQVKFQSGGAIVPLGLLTAGNFIHVAGDINASGGGSNPAAPYPQGPRYNDGTGALINGGKNFSGGGFFTGYWLTTGAPTQPADATHSMRYGNTAPLSNGIFVGGWYSITNKFSMTSGTSGVHVCPNPATQALPQMMAPGAVVAGQSVMSLTSEQVTPLIQESSRQGSVIGLNTTSFQTTGSEIEDLPGRIPGQESNRATQTDDKAADMKWFIDPTPRLGSGIDSRMNTDPGTQQALTFHRVLEAIDLSALDLLFTRHKDGY